MAKWKRFFDPQGNVGGVEDENGRVVAKFNCYDPPSFRAALAKNILWVQGCVYSDEQDFKGVELRSGYVDQETLDILSKK